MAINRIDEKICILSRIDMWLNKARESHMFSPSADIVRLLRSFSCCCAPAGAIYVCGRREIPDGSAAAVAVLRRRLALQEVSRGAAYVVNWAAQSVF